MREFRFRVWNKKMREMHVRVEIQQYDDGSLCVTSEYGSSDEFILMQYTGIKDAKGIEIYEGDIVVAPDGHIGLSNFKVFWRKDRWHLDNGRGGSFDNGDYYHGDEVSWEEVEVIGNICENPELLKAAA